MTFRMGGARAGKTDMTADHPRRPSALRGYLEALVHPLAGADARARRRHRLFLLRHLAPGALALALLPLALAFAGTLTPALVLVFAWLTAQLPLAMYVSRSGRLDRGEALSAGLFALFVGGLAAVSGGIASPVLPLLALVPVEAVLAQSRRALVALLGLALTILALLAALPGLPADASATAPVAGLLPPAALGLVHAALVALRLADALAAETDRAETAAARAGMVARLGGLAVGVIGPGGRVETLGPAGLPGLDGLGAADLLGDGLFARLHVGDRPAFLKAVSDALADGRPVALDLRLRLADGRHGWVGLAAEPLAGRADALGFTLADIGARKAGESARLAAEAAALAARAGEARFLATVNHELRTPLNAILGFSELIRALPPEGLDRARVADYAGLIHESGSHLLALVDALLDRARLETGALAVAPERFDLRACLDGCRRMMEPEAARRGVTLAADLPLSLGDVVADPRACRQMALNLLSNALKFTPAGGRAVLFARLEATGPAFGVHDTGIGIAPQDRERILLPFVRLASDPPREGAGIGLAVVKGLAELHGGRVEVAGHPGGGSCFTVRLPHRPAGSAPKDRPVATPVADIAMPARARSVPQASASGQAGAARLSA